MQNRQQVADGKEPTGTINISENGSYNVKNYAEANVNIPNDYNVKANSTNFNNISGIRDLLTEITNINIGTITVLTSFFAQCKNLKKVELFDTSNVTEMTYMFNGDTYLQDVPIFNTTRVSYMVDMFASCSNLTDESLNNILAMATNSIVTTSANKKISKLGLSQAQAIRCRTLSNYQSFINAGWVDDYQ